MGPVTIGQLGERRIVREILRQYVTGIGDDCAVVQSANTTLILTTDPVPEPAAKLIGKDPDPFWMGWLLVVINASDLAAAGARPLAFLAAVEAPSALSLSDFERFLSGVREACGSEGLAYVGGNLREGPRLSAVGTAVGECGPNRAITRLGAREGDFVGSVGTGGRFWRDALMLEAGSLFGNKDSSPVFRPASQIRAMRALAEAGLVAAAIDNSDGLLPSLTQLAVHNDLGIELDLDLLHVPGVHEGVDPARLWLGWGDWNVVVCVRPEHWSEAEEACRSNDTPLIRIGRTRGKDPFVQLRRGSKTLPAPRLESERFSDDSWFSAGISAYVSALMNVELP